MNSPTASTIGQAPLPCPVIIPPQAIELRGLIDDHAATFAIFQTADGGQRIMQVLLFDLLPFTSFRNRVRDVLGLNIEYRGDTWFRDVMDAAERGGVEITVDQLTLAIWMGDDWISFDEAKYIAEVSMLPAVRDAAKQAERRIAQ